MIHSIVINDDLIRVIAKYMSIFKNGYTEIVEALGYESNEIVRLNVIHNLFMNLNFKLTEPFIEKHGETVATYVVSLTQALFVVPEKFEQLNNGILECDDFRNSGHYLRIAKITKDMFDLIQSLKHIKNINADIIPENGIEIEKNESQYEFVIHFDDNIRY